MRGRLKRSYGKRSTIHLTQEPHRTIIPALDGAVAQLGERRVRNA